MYIKLQNNPVIEHLENQSDRLKKIEGYPLN